MTPPTNGTPAAEHSHEDVRTSTVDAAVTLAKSFGLFQWIVLLGVGAISTLLALGWNVWAQDIVAKHAAPLVQAHHDAGAHAAAATKADLKTLNTTLTETNSKLDALLAGLGLMQVQAVEASKDRAAVLCKAIKNVAIKGDQCVLKKTRHRPKRSIPLTDLKALRAEVYGE